MTEPISSSRIAEMDIALQPLPDLHQLTHEIRNRGRMSMVKIFGAPAAILTHYEDVIAAYRDEETFPAKAAYSVIAGPVMGHTIQCMSGEEHRLHRALVRSAFKPSVARDYVPTVFASAAHRIIDRFADRGQAELISDFSRQFSFDIICRVIGITDVANDQLHEWVSGLFGYPSDPESAIATTKKFNNYMTGLLEKRRREPQDDLLTGLLNAEIEGSRLDDEQILSFIRLLFPAGADTTFYATGSMLYYLLNDPEAMERVRANPQDRERAIEETLRIEPPVTMQPRMNPKAVSWRGLDIPQGFLIFGTSAANRDPAFFPDPDRFDLDRQYDHQLATFGQGQHFCLGSHFARGEMKAALDTLLERLPGLRLLNDEGAQVLGGTLRGPKRLNVAFDT
jgi:cytochrome P450